MTAHVEAPAARGAPRRVVEFDRARVALLAVALLCVGGGALAGGSVAVVAGVVAMGMSLTAILGSRLLDWRVLTVLILIATFLFPVRRIVLQMSLPFGAEPYRLVVIAVALLWLVALLVDPRVRIRSTPFDWQLAVLFAAVLMSIAANPRLVNLYAENTVKALSLVISYLLVYYFVASVLTRRADAELLIRALVIGTSIVAIAALVERITAVNVFDRLGLLPGLDYVPPVAGDEGAERAGRLRVIGSAEHSIALGALLAMVTPLTFYLARRTRLWLLTTAVLLAAVAATVSRTPVIMLAVSLVVFAWLRPRGAVRVVTWFSVLLIAAAMVLPGLVRPTVEAFFPRGGLISEQDTELFEGGSTTIGRLGDLQFALRDFERSPIVGHGYGTRVIDPLRTARFLPDGRYGGILDNQWLASLLDIGAVGVGALVWLFAGAGWLLFRAARERTDDDAFLAAALGASLLSYAIGMLFFDAFAFTQVTLVLFFVFGVSAVFLRSLPPLPTRSGSLRARLELLVRRKRIRVSNQIDQIGGYSAGRRSRE